MPGPLPGPVAQSDRHARTHAPLALMACPVCGVGIVGEVTLASPSPAAVTLDNLDAVPTTLAAVRLSVRHDCQTGPNQ